MDKLSFNAENVMQSIRMLSVKIGPRFSGSPNCLKAADWIEDYFRQLNLNVSDQSFDMPVGTLENFKLEILEPNLGEILCRPLYFTPDTQPEGLIGDLVYVENLEALPVDVQLAGKIILLPVSAFLTNRIPSKVFELNPAAVIAISGDPGFKPRHDLSNEMWSAPFNPVPIFRITWEDGYRIVQAHARKARLTLHSTRGMSKGRNIIGELPGIQYPDEIITVTGHYDSPPDTPSATDDASGTAMMMELARIYCQRGSKRTLRFIAVDAEERGMVGSRHYVQTLYCEASAQKKLPQYDERRDKTLLDKHSLCINMDVLGMALGQHSCYVIGPAELATAIQVLDKELGLPQQIIVDSMYGSDHEPFAWAGIPAIDFSRIGPSMRYIHTADDTIDLINPERLQELGEMIETFIQRYVADAVCWPFDRKIPDHLSEMVKTRFEKVLKWKLEE